MANGVAYISEVPIIEIRETVAIIRSRSGADEVHYRAMSTGTLAKFCERAQLALREHAAGDRAIIVDR